MQAADRIVTAAEMAEIDRRAQEDFGISGLLLMENAGQKAWAVVRDLLRTERMNTSRPRIAFIAGNGNNGGDALVMARQACIEDEVDVLIVTVTGELKGSAQQHWQILHRLGARRLVWQDDSDGVRTALDDVEWIVDGIAGTGLSGALRDPVGVLVDTINRSPASVVAVDVPSGMRDGRRRGELAVRAHVTVVTGYLKAMLFEGHNRSLAGDIRQVDPGFPSSIVNDPRVVPSRIRRMPIPPDHPVPVKSDAHKGRRGRVLVIGGSSGTAGAAVLSAEGAGAAGAGMIRVLASAQGVTAVLARNPSFMARDMSAPDGGGTRREAVEWADVAVLGPGWTTLTDTDLAEWMTLCEESTTACVLDASALRVLAQRGEAWDRLYNGAVPSILTPHRGEWRALASEEDDDGEVREMLERFPRRQGLTVVVKSSVTWVRHATDEVDILDGRVPTLAVAGSGDVLSGVLAAALARVVAAGLDTPAMIRDSLRWGLARHLHAGRSLAGGGRSVSAADIAARIAAGLESHHG